MSSSKRNRQRAVEDLADYVHGHPWATKAEIMAGMRWSWGQVTGTLGELKRQVDNLPLVSALTLVVDRRNGEARYGLTEDHDLIAENAIFEGRYLWTRTYNGAARLVDALRDSGKTARARRVLRKTDGVLDEIEDTTRELAVTQGYEAEVIDSWFVRMRELVV